MAGTIVPMMMLALGWSAALLAVAAADDFCSELQRSNSDAHLFSEPPCAQTVEQRPSFDNSSLTYVGVPVRNLNFCCNANYTAILPVGTNITELDEEARHLAWFVERFLSRYDCSHFYPFHTCEPCRDAYRTWVCSQMFPMKCLGDSAALQVCKDVCLEVQRKCPSEMHFFCPLDDNTDDDGDGIYADWVGGSDTELFGRGGCNPMHYNLGPGSPYSAAAQVARRWAAVAPLAALLMATAIGISVVAL